MTAPVSAHDVAREVRSRLREDVPSKKLQKLLYYCQGWHLAWTGRPLFVEHVEAYRMGPVVPALWAHEKYRPNEPGPSPIELTAEQSSIVQYVIDRYGHFNGGELERMTHREAPWINARNSSWSDVISIESMRVFFLEDDELRARNAEVARLRARGDMFALGPRALDAGTLAAVDRARRGDIVRDR